MADIATTPEEEAPEPGAAPDGRRLWERFSLSVLAFLLLLLAQGSFGLLIRDYSATFEISPGPLAAYLAFGILAGFAAGMALVLPGRMAVRHPRRGIALGLLPTAVTALNVVVALAPGSLPEGIGQFTATHLIGLQTTASLLLGMAAASATAES